MLFVTAPDKWKGRYQSATGDAYELITEYNERWEYDGTPADLLLNDGKRYTIVGIINVYSRELKLEVAERSTGRTALPAGLGRATVGRDGQRQGVCGRVHAGGLS